MTFPPKVREQLKWYVYLYLDPRTGVPFYVGKGKDNRVFAHMGDTKDTEKVRVISDLKKLGLKPVLELLKYGMTEEQALLVESTAIDLVALSKLTNEYHGHGCNCGSRASVQEISMLLAGKVARIVEPSLLINVTGYRSVMSPQEVYDQTRSAWKVGAKRHKVELVFCVHDRVIREVYRPTAWLLGGSTKRVGDDDGSRAIEKGRYEFVGRIAETLIRKRYVGRRISDTDFDPKSQNPIRYLNLHSETE